MFKIRSRAARLCLCFFCSKLLLCSLKRQRDIFEGKLRARFLHKMRKDRVLTRPLSLSLFLSLSQTRALASSREQTTLFPFFVSRASRPLFSRSNRSIARRRRTKKKKECVLCGGSAGKKKLAHRAKGPFTSGEGGAKKEGAKFRANNNNGKRIILLRIPK